MKGLYDEARKTAREYEEIFGKGNFFLELQDHGIEEQAQVNPMLIRMSEELDIPLVATNDVHYTYAEDATAHDILLCIQLSLIHICLDGHDFVHTPTRRWKGVT